MATFLTQRAINPVKSYKNLYRHLTSAAKVNATAAQTPQDAASAAASSSSSSDEGDHNIHIKLPGPQATSSSASSNFVPRSWRMGSIIGKRFYKQVTTKEAEGGIGWSVMLDYRTLKTPSGKPLKLRTLALAKAIAAEWEYQQIDGIRPFTMPLMRLACTAVEMVPLTRPKMIEHLMKKFDGDLVFWRATEDDDLKRGVYELQVQKIDPLLDWVNAEFGTKPVLWSGFSIVKQEDRLIKAIEDVLKKTNDWELAAIESMASAGHSLVIAIALFRGRLQIEEAIELIRIEEDFQVENYGFVEGGHGIDIADLRVHISSAVAFLGLSRRT